MKSTKIVGVTNRKEEYSKEMVYTLETSHQKTAFKEMLIGDQNLASRL